MDPPRVPRERPSVRPEGRGSHQETTTRGGGEEESRSEPTPSGSGQGEPRDLTRRFKYPLQREEPLPMHTPRPSHSNCSQGLQQVS